MKKYLFFFVLIINSFNVFAQTHDNDGIKKSFFKKENLFAGGVTGFGIGSGNFSLAVGSQIGYSLNKYIDVALILNYSYL